MVMVRDSLNGLLERATVDSALLSALADDLLGTLQRSGVQVTLTDLKQLLGLPQATDHELLELLRCRLARNWSGCGTCGSIE